MNLNREPEDILIDLIEELGLGVCIDEMNKNVVVELNKTVNVKFNSVFDAISFLKNMKIGEIN